MPAAKKNSKGSEKGTWNCLSKQIPEFRPTRIESRTEPGISDVWAGDCAIELKCLKNYPVKDDQPIRLEHPLSVAQYRWLNDRWDLGFKSFVLVQVRIKYFHLFCAPDAFILVPGHEQKRAVWYKYNCWYSAEGIKGPPEIMSINDTLRMTHEALQHYRMYLTSNQVERRRI